MLTLVGSCISNNLLIIFLMHKQNLLLRKEYFLTKFCPASAVFLRKGLYFWMKEFYHVHINKKSCMTTSTSTTVQTEDVTLKMEYNA